MMIKVSQTQPSISQLHGPPVVMRWYNLPLAKGAHATEVMAYEVPEGTLAGFTTVEVCSGLTDARVLEADEGVASTVGQEGISPMRHSSLISHRDKISGTETKVFSPRQIIGHWDKSAPQSIGE